MKQQQQQNTKWWYFDCWLAGKHASRGSHYDDYYVVGPYNFSSIRTRMIAQLLPVLLLLLLLVPQSTTAFSVQKTKTTSLRRLEGPIIGVRRFMKQQKESFTNPFDNVESSFDDTSLLLDDEDLFYAQDNSFDVLATDSYYYDDGDLMEEDEDVDDTTMELLQQREDRYYNTTRSAMRERCVLVGVEELSQQYRARKDESASYYFSLQESLMEMRELVKTAGMECVGEITQRMQEIHPKTYIGTGKVQEVIQFLNDKQCCTVILDAELSPGQQKALENAFNQQLKRDPATREYYQSNNSNNNNEKTIKVIDRTALILDIFAQHAKTREGKLQVDLALHEYRKPRLTKLWTHLERQSAGGGVVGLRGPGESQLEIDKRLLRDRIIVLKQKIDQVQKQRTMHRRKREKMGLPILALVGYTNAGKSSLLNFLTKANVMAESMLFATLDPTTRKVKLPGYKTHPEVLLTDTVGFIQKLPTHLVAAFRATLEEVREADVLIHVIDVSNPTWEKQEQAVLSTLASIGVADKPIVRVLNKIDALEPLVADQIKFETASMKSTVAVSALKGDGMQDFVAVTEEALAELLVSVELLMPYSKGDELNSIHEQGNVEVVDYRETGTYVKALVPPAIASRLREYSVTSSPSSPSAAADGTTVIQTGSAPATTEDDGIDWVALGRGRHDAKQ